MDEAAVNIDRICICICICIRELSASTTLIGSGIHQRKEKKNFRRWRDRYSGNWKEAMRCE